MHALVWTGPRRMELQDLPEPEAGAGEVLLRVATAGICGSDLSGYIGQNSLRVPPLVMGHEFSGVVEAVGPGEPRLASGELAETGQRVVANPLISCGACDLCRAGRANLCRRRQIVGIHRPGGLADLVAVPAGQCHAVPASLSDLDAALTEPLACGIRGVNQARIAPGDALLILGAGSIGLLCLVAARATGAGTITITDMSAERLEVAAALGATATIRADQADVLAEVQRLTDGDGVAAAIDAVGLPATRRQAVRAVRPGGRAVFMGLHHETSELEANYVVRQEVEVAGAFAYLPDEFGRALALLAAGALSGSSTWVTERNLAEGAQIFADLTGGHTNYVKVALRPSSAGRTPGVSQ